LQQQLSLANAKHDAEIQQLKSDIANKFATIEVLCFAKVHFRPMQTLIHFRRILVANFPD
jgi:hypothetical protein